MDPPGGRAVHLGDAARLHRHDRPAGARTRGARRVRARASGVRRRPRRLVDATELLGRRRGRDPRGRPADRRGRARAGRPVRHADRRVPAAAPRRARARRPTVPRLSRPTKHSPDRRKAHRPIPSSARSSSSPLSAHARDEPRRGAQGRALTRAPGVAEVRRAGSGRARAPRARGDRDRRGRRPRRSASPPIRPIWRSSRCTAATARTAPCRSCSR